MTEPSLFANKTAPADPLPNPLPDPLPEPSSDPLAGLNQAQLEAVTHTTGPLAVIAGPGTGKTRVITRRIAHLINEGVQPEHIVALTFTKKAAREMRERIGALVGTSTADRLFAGTFHSFASTLLARFADLAGLPSRPTPTDAALQKRLMRDLVREAFDAGRTPKDMLAQGLDNIVDQAKLWCAALAHDGVQPTEAAPLVDRWRALADHAKDDDEREGLLAEARAFELYAWLYERFAARCLEQRLASYDDLLLLPTRLLEQSELARTLARDAYRHLVVDEYQDVNHAQIRLLRALAAPERSPNLCAVGDDDQAIYGFRGATDLAFQTFTETWPGARTVTLTDNHRSSAAVIEATNHTISLAHERAAPDKAIVPRRAFDPPAPGAIECVDLAESGPGVPVIAALLRDARAHNPEHTWSDTAVICRGNTTVAAVAEGLRLAGIPVNSHSDVEQRDEPAVADLLAWVELLAEPGATWAARRLLLRPPYAVEIDRVSRLERTYKQSAAEQELLGQAATGGYVAFLAREDDDRVGAFVALHARLSEAAARLPAGEALRRILEQAGLATADLPDPIAYARRVRLLASIVRFAETRARFFDPPADLAAFWHYQLDLGEEWFEVQDELESDEDDDPPDAVAVMTAHKSKGLEFDTVYVPRLDHHGFSKKSSSSDPSLPIELRPGAPESRTDTERQQDEARRLFYVASTRAERRLVLLSKPVKKSEFNLYQEHVLNRQEQVQRLSEAEVLDRVRPSLPEPLPAGDASTRARALANILEDARRRAADAMHEAGTAAVTTERAAELAEIVERSIRTSAAARAASGGGDAGGLVSAEEADWLTALFRSAEPDAIDPANPVLHAPQRAPLHLSYSRISLYRQCPLCYYARYIAGLGEPPNSRLSIGNVTHKALERYYARWRSADADGRPLPGLGVLLELADEAFAEAVREGEPLVAADRARISAMLEITHERLHDPRAHIEQLEHKIRFPFEHDGVTHTIEARLDRVDRLPDGSLRLIDYKTGKAAEKLLEPPPSDLQLGLYSLAIEHEQGPCEGEAEYWLLSTGERGSRAFSSMNTDLIRKHIGGVIGGLLEGEFRRKPSGCQGDCAAVRAACNPTDRAR